MWRLVIRGTLLAVLVQATAGANQKSDTNTSAEPDKASVADFLGPDGRFDLEAARRSGYQGPLDMKGYEPAFDSASGQPVFRPAAAASPADHPDDIYWDNSISPSIPGVDDDVSTVIVYNGRLIVGGIFDVAGDVIANYIAAWDGSSWSPLGSGTNSYVDALTVYNNRLIAGGEFTTAGGVDANYIAAWDGSSWSPLGSGMSNYVLALTVYDNKLIAGGRSTTAGGVAANYIAAWDGSSWSPLGSGMGEGDYYPYVHALSVYDNQLIAGGGFDTAGGVAASGIAAWDGSSWSPLGSGMTGMSGSVRALTVYDNRLIAGGGFTTAGGVAANSIAAWDGSSWSPLGSGMNYNGVYDLTVYDNRLIAGGRFTTAGGGAANYIAAWDGFSWSPLGSGMGGSQFDVLALTVYDSKLIAGGEFTTAGGGAANKIASWDGSSWSSLGSGTNSYVRALTVYNNRLIAGGSFTTAGGVAANYIAAWDGSSWSPLGSGMNYYVLALTVYDNRLIAGGSFFTAGGVEANRIAAWDGSSWSSLGSGMSGPVYALTVYNNKLIAGGYFYTAGGVAARFIAAWDGSSWSPLGSGMNYYVCALTVYDNRLIAGGRFVEAGGVAVNYIAAWDGFSWSPLGSGMNDWVYALTVYDNRLIAGGYFTTAGAVNASRIAAWDGSSWSPLGSGMAGDYPPVRALTVYDNQLIAGGVFVTAGGVAASRIAAWDGSSWSSLGSGMGGYNPNVSALTVYDNRLIAGGRFAIAGGKVSAYVAQWTKVAAGFCDGFTGLFCDDFEDGIITEWQTLRDDGDPIPACEWSETGGSFSTFNDVAEQWCIQSVGDQTWDNYVLEAKVRGNSGVDKVLVFRIQDADNFYAVNLRSDYPLPGDDQLTFDKMVDGVYDADIATANIASENGVWYQLKVACVDNSFKVYINDQLVLQYTDMDNPYYTGGIGVACWTGAHGNCDVSFDDVAVRAFQVIDLVLDNVSGQTTGDFVSFDGHLIGADHTPYLPPQGYQFTVYDPVAESAVPVSVDVDGSFAYTSPSPASTSGPFTFIFEMPHDYGISYVAWVTGLTDTREAHIFQTEVPIGYGLQHELDWRTNALSTKYLPTTKGTDEIPYLPPPFSHIDEAAKQLGSEMWRRVTYIARQIRESPTSSVVFGTMAASCGTTLAGGVVFLPLCIKSASILAKDALVADMRYLVEEKITTPENREEYLAVFDAASIIASLVTLDLNGGIIDFTETMGHLTEYSVENIEIFDEQMWWPAFGVPQFTYSIRATDNQGKLHLYNLMPSLDRTLIILGHSPIDLVITDQQGDVVSKDMTTMVNAFYSEEDLDLDGEPEDVIFIGDHDYGTLTVSTVPDPGSSSETTFTITAHYSYSVEVDTIASHVPISEIGGEQYEVDVFENLSPLAFSLISPQGGVLHDPFTLQLTWQETSDPNPGHEVYYDLMLATGAGFADSIVIYEIAATEYDLASELLGDPLDNEYYWKVRARDLWGAATYSTETFSFTATGPTCCTDRVGDANGLGGDEPTIGDVSTMIDALFIGGDPVVIACLAEADINQSGGSDPQPSDITIGDISTLIDYLFITGPSLGLPECL